MSIDFSGSSTGAAITPPIIRYTYLFSAKQNYGFDNKNIALTIFTSDNKQSEVREFTMQNKTIPMILFLGVFELAVARTAWCAGFDNNNVGLRGMSMATAYHGIADDGSAVYYNPAGLALIEKGEMNVEAYAYVIFTKFRYENETEAGTLKNESSEIPVIPGGFISQSFDRWGVGLGVAVPYGGGGVVYKNFLESGNTLEASAGFFGISAAAAVELVKQYLSIGVTPTIYIGAMENKANPQPGSDLRMVSENSGFAGVGGTLGIMSEVLKDKLKLGLTFRSPVKMRMDGTLTMTSAALPEPMKSDSTLDFLVPMELTLGVGVTPIPALTLGLTGTVIFHGMMDKITLTSTAVNPLTGQEETTETPSKTYYKHNFRLALGGEYMIIKQLGVRVGLQFIQSPSKDEGLVPTSNDVSQLLPSLGLAWNIVKFLELGVTGQYVIGFERERKGEASVPLPDGTVVAVPMTERYDTDHWLLLAGLRFNWDFIE